MQHHAARADAAVFADLDIAEHLGADGDKHAAPHLRMTVARFLARAAQRHVVQHRHIVFHHRRLADHDAGRMVDEDAPAEPCGGMDVDGEEFGNAALQVERHRAAALVPQPMRNAVALQRMEAFEIEQRLDVGMAGGIAVVIGDDVGPRRLADIGRFRQRFVEQLAKLHRMHFRVPELLRQMIGDRVVQVTVIENGGIKEAGEDRFARGHLLGLGAHALPHGIAKR